LKCFCITALLITDTRVRKKQVGLFKSWIASSWGRQ
jgi:hypothetical protein